MEVLVVIIGMVALISFISWVVNISRKATRYDELKPRLEDLDNYQGRLAQREQELERRKKEWNEKVQSDIKAVHTLAEEKSEGFPWLAEAYADYFHLQDQKAAKHLRTKKHPARKAAEEVRKIARQRRVAEKLYRVLKYQLEYYENLFPWLVDFKGEDLDDLIRQILERKEKGEGLPDEPDDPVRKWLTAAEYEKLSRVEKNQLALDRYWQKKKSKWEIGRDYERYIGYLYERSGCNVYYQGIIKGLEDLGRDLIAVKGGYTEIVQCKNWSAKKTIHEKHIFQLFGTTVEYWLKNRRERESTQHALFPELLRNEKIKSTFITSTKLSEKAREFAKVLRIHAIEGFPFKSYPSIKCNVSRRADEKIYHLPFDQQYDRTVVEDERNECYAERVEEAEGLGFRRAFRWKGKMPSA